MRSVFALCTSLGLLGAGARAAWAQTPEQEPAPAVLNVTRDEGAESCPDTEALTAHVERVRGHRATGETSAYHVAFTYRGGVFRADIRSDSGGGTRVLRDRGNTCAALEQATALTLALLIDSDASEPIETIEEPEPPPPPPPPPPIVPPVPERPSRPVRFVVSAGGGALLGVTSEVAPVALADLGIGAGLFRTSLGVLWMPEQGMIFGPGEVRQSLIGGTARMCLSTWHNQTLGLDVCSGFYAGLLHVRASGYTRNDNVDKAWLAFPLGIAISTSAPFGVELGASALIPLRRNDFSVDNLGVVYSSLPVGALLSLRAVGSWVL
jgi:hypothetical protein